MLKPKNLPKISIITPSYNQGSYIEQTIKSVLSQGYPNLEYIVIDGGSEDETVEILKKYDKKIIWLSQKDKGQADAINKGLRLSTGDILGYLNSDDLYRSGTLFKIAGFFNKFSDIAWLSGRCQMINEVGQEKRNLITYWKNFWLYAIHSRDWQYKILLILNYLSQPATFWRRQALENIGLFDKNLHYTMDYDYWLRLLEKYKLGILKDELASFRIHNDSKSAKYSKELFSEGYLVAGRYTNSALLKFLHRLHDLFTLTIYRII